MSVFLSEHAWLILPYALVHPQLKMVLPVSLPFGAQATNKLTASVVQASLGLLLHQMCCPSSHANVVQKTYPALKTWQSVRKGSA